MPVTRGLFPHWLLTWPMILVAVGLFSGIRSGFRGASWLVVLIIGFLFLLHQQSWFNFGLRPYFWPLALIIVGLVIYLKRSPQVKRDDLEAGPGTAASPSAVPLEDQGLPPPETAHPALMDTEESLNVNALLGHVERRIYAKRFKGGQISSIFGGANINLSHSDIQGTVTLNISVLFGGVEIILPSNWQVKNEVSVILGGMDDRRLPEAGGLGSEGKVLIIKGSVIFGGVELKNF